MEQEKEACDKCKKGFRLIHEKGVLSFFKVMIDKSFLQVLHFPPKFARLVQHLKDQETYLEDSSGGKWRVTVSNHNGSLSIRQGWPIFSSDHGLDVGDFLVFHYVPSQHFIVQIFGTSGCVKSNFCSDIGKGRKRARTYPDATIPDELLLRTRINSVKQKSKISAESEYEKRPRTCAEATIPAASQITDVNSVKQKSKISAESEYEKRPRTCTEATIPAAIQITDVNSVKQKSKVSAESYPEKVAYKPNISNFATNIDVDTGKGKSVHSAIDVDESFCMIDRSAQYDQEDDRLCLHLSSFEMPASRPRAQGTNIPLKVDPGNDNHVETNLRSQTEEKINVKIDNINSEAPLSKLKAGITATTNMVCRRAETIPPQGPKHTKPKEASQFAREEVTLVKKEFEEITTEVFSPARAIRGGDFAIANEIVIKSEPADSGDAPSLNPVSYSCLLEIDGRDFLELPESWLKHLLKRAKLGRMIIFLQGLDKRIWPILYHRRSGINVLTSRWKQFTAAYGLNPGDECLFQLVNQRGCIFDVRKIESV